MQWSAVYDDELVSLAERCVLQHLPQQRRGAEGQDHIVLADRVAADGRDGFAGK